MDFINFVNELKNSENGVKTICELAKKNNIDLSINKEDQIKVDMSFVKFVSTMKARLISNKSNIHIILSKDNTNIYFDSIININGDNSEIYLIGDEFYIISMDIDLCKEEDKHNE